jgi:hypothetical protein
MMGKEKVYIRDKFKNLGVDVGIENTEMPNIEARFAMSMLERWGSVQGVQDGEDSAGRSKIGLMSVEDTVSRACCIADRAFKQFRDNGWMIDVPTHEEAEEQYRKEHDKD